MILKGNRIKEVFVDMRGIVPVNIDLDDEREYDVELIITQGNKPTKTIKIEDEGRIIYSCQFKVPDDNLTSKAE